MLVTSSMTAHRGLLAASLLAFAIALLAPAAASAQLVARAMVTIKDAATDAPLEGAKVTFAYKDTNYRGNPQAPTRRAR